jgi:hypothetical protein
MYRLQEKHVKEKQIEHQKNIIELQEKLKKNLNQVGIWCPLALLLKYL